MKKRKLPKDAVAVETYKWDPDLQNYVLVKREPVERQEEPAGIAGKQRNSNKCSQIETF